MPVQHEVRCVTRSDRDEPHARILYIGGLNDDYTRWQLTQDEAIAGIESGKWAFYVTRSGHTLDVIVATDGAGRKYLKTTADGEQPNILLSLTACPTGIA